MNAAAAIRAKLLAKYPAAVLIGREVNLLKHRLPDLNGRPHFAVDAAMGPIHYQDDAGALQEIDNALVTDGADGFSVRTGQTPYLLRMTNTGKRRLYPNRYDLGRYVEFSALPSMGTPVRGENYLTWDRPHYAVRLESLGSAIKFTFTLKDALAPTSISFNVTLAGLTRQGRVLLADGVPVAVMRVPTAIDAAGTERKCTFTLSAGKVTIALDTTGLIFPIEIDPSVDTYPWAGEDDCYYNNVTTTFVNDGVYIQAGYYSDTSYKIGAGMRFGLAAHTLPAGVTITHAHFSVMPYGADAGAACYTMIRGQKNAWGAFASKADFQARRINNPELYITKNEVAWGPIDAWTVDATYKESPEIKAVIQERVCVVNWCSSANEYIELFWDDYDDDSTHAAGNRRRAYSREQGETRWPLLHLEYTPHASFGQVF